MKKILISLLIVTCCYYVSAQKEGDKKIIVKVADTSNFYTKVKLAIIQAGFTVRDDMNYTLLTSNVEVKKHLGYTIVKARISNDTVTIWGLYSNKNKNLYGIEIAPGTYNNILYFKNNKGHGWDILYAIATKIDAHDLNYSK